MSNLLPILEYPEPSLEAPSEPVDPEKIEEVQDLINDMIYTMFFHGGVGLAAPQVGRNLRIFIVDQRPINGNPQTEPWVFINPVIEPVTENRVGRREGCLSFPGFFASVDRAEFVKITALNRKGEEFTMDASHNHLFSVALQHEYDHLEGTLMSDRVRKRDQKKLKKWSAKRG